MNPIIDRIQKLLVRTTENGCTQGEADAAMAQVSRLLTEHNLSMADVSKNTTADAVYVEEFTFQTGRWSAIHNLAYTIVREFCFVEGIFGYSRGNQRRVKKLYLFGLQDNVSTARFMFTSLLSSFDHLWDIYRARTLAPVKDKYSFTSGVAAGFSDKMRAERRNVADEQYRQTGRSTEIILAGVAEKTAIAFKEKYKDLKHVKSTFGVSDRSSEARAAGYQAGQKLNINKGLNK